jgi:addiction module HigA family antidote
VMPLMLTMTIITESRAMISMFNPPHPGETLREDVLPAMGLTITEAAKVIGVSRVALTRVLNVRAADTN